ncbi:OB-fold protein [Clostridium neuense]|uniref:OB-fold protein n=1 Tax=Clostridium neuense TaxID=1728934 RepID=A0ABW8TKV6_9CLOT
MSENKSLTSCKACGKEIAKGVKKCPHCGKDQRNFFMKHKIITVILALVILGGIGSAMGGNKNATTSTNTTDTKKTEKKKVEAITVSAVDLAKAYEDNEVNADKNYKGKTVLTSGTINDIGVIAGQTFIVLSSGKDFAVTNVQCFFKEKGEIDKISNLKKGDTVTIQGVVDGKSMNVGVNNCVLK